MRSSNLEFKRAFPEAQVRAYVIADNKLAECAGWDRDLLALELQGLAEIDLDFELEVTGFETAEIDLMISAVGEGEESDPADEVEADDPDAPIVSRPGDLWQIGPHRLLCADALDPDSYARLMGDQNAQMVFVDPPFERDLWKPALAALLEQGWVVAGAMIHLESPLDADITLPRRLEVIKSRSVGQVQLQLLQVVD